MSENDLIRRGDALALPHRLSPSLDADDGYFVSVDAIRALPAAPTFTAADLEKAWEMGRDAVQVFCLQPCGTVRVRRPKNPPADLAQRVKGPAHD